MNQIVFVENALLIRFGLLRALCHSIISVCVKNQNVLIERLIKRDGSSEEVAKNILKNQSSLKDFQDYSNYIIYNDEIKALFVD